MPGYEGFSAKVRGRTRVLDPGYKDTGAEVRGH